MLCAPILTPGDTRGLLKVSARRPHVLGAYEADLVREFLPLASLAIQFSRKAETLEKQVVLSERKHILANLTQGTSHDVNNALGAVIPLIQQIRDDAARGVLEPEILRADLDHMERSLQTCRRIFGGMLSVARGAGRPVGLANLRRAIDTALSVLEERFRRRGVTVELDLPREIPEVRAGQNDATQLFLNLFSNADEAMPGGGAISVTVRPARDRIAVRVSDTGVGMAPDVRGRIFESFYSTKPEGNGLGLTVVSSVVRQMGGAISVESKEGEGTVFLLDLPAVTGEDT
jgi:signal transduction histidine kinase